MSLEAHPFSPRLSSRLGHASNCQKPRRAPRAIAQNFDEEMRQSRAQVRNITDMLVESTERMQRLEKHKNQTERVAEEGAKPAEDKVIDEDMPDNKVINEEMRQSRKQIERWHQQGDAVIKRGCVLCWPDKAMCSPEVCRARTRAAALARAAAANTRRAIEGNDTKSAEDSSASLEGFKLSCVDNVLDPSVEIGAKSARRKINGSCGSATKA